MFDISGPRTASSTVEQAPSSRRGIKANDRDIDDFL